MSKEQDTRATIIHGLRAHRTVKEISEFNNIPLSTVYSVKARYDEDIAAGASPNEVSSQRKQHQRRSDAKDGDFVKQVQVMIDEACYINVLRTVVEPWMRQVAAGRHFVFQQDGAPAHTANTTQDWLLTHLPEFWPKEIWPPNSPDCNPLDYYVWGVCERDVNKHPHNNVDSLKAKITEVMQGMGRQEIVKACKRFRARVEAVIDNDGDFFE